MHEDKRIISNREVDRNIRVNKMIVTNQIADRLLTMTLPQGFRPRLPVPQLAMSPSIIERVPVKKMTSTQRRAAKIAAGKLKVVEGKLSGTLIDREFVRFLERRQKV